MEQNRISPGPSNAPAAPSRMAAIIQGMWWRTGSSLPSDVRDDCELEASLALWQARNRLSALPESQREAYAAVCVRRRVGEVLRRERRHQARTVSLDAMQTEEGTVIDLRDRGVAAGEAPASGRLADQVGCPTLAAVVRALPARDQDILDLYYVRDLTDAEIAGRLDASPAAVKVQRHRAIGKIRRKVESAG